MALVSVSEESISSLIDILQAGRCNLENDVVELRRAYYLAGNEWNDKKYRQLGDLIDRICRHILVIGCDLGDAKEKLKKLQKAVEDYIESGKASSSNNANAYARVIERFSWNAIDGEHSMVDDLKSSNPNYELNDGPWGTNCQRCVPTYELRRRGYDVTALPKPSNAGTNDLSFHPFDVWENPVVQRASGNGREDIESQMAQWGDGSRAQVTVIWEDGDLGHTFIAEQVNGQTRFIDPQSGSENVNWYFSHVQEGETRFCRVDNLNISSRIFECCQEVHYD